MIICAGEILADMIGKEEGGIVTYERHAGGAPFNVACGLKKLGAACGFCGSVGSDLIGDFLSRFAEDTPPITFFPRARRNASPPRRTSRISARCPSPNRRAGRSRTN